MHLVEVTQILLIGSIFVELRDRAMYEMCTIECRMCGSHLTCLGWYVRISACFRWKFVVGCRMDCCCCFFSFMKEQLLSMLTVYKIFLFSVSSVNKSGAAAYFWLFRCCFYVQ